jgi:hypothetical protein
MSTLTSFHLFPMLPSELRIKVWNLALSLPRVVTVSCERERLSLTRRFAKAFISQTAVPALLHTCRESRLEGFLTYKPMFKTDTSPIYTYVSLKHDTIQCADTMLEYLGEEEAEHLQRMILEVKDAAYFGHFHMDVLMRMRKLRELDLLVQQEVIGWNRGRRYLDILIGDFEQARIEDPAWECPRVRIVDRNTGKELSVIPGGAAPPEWMEGGTI